MIDFLLKAVDLKDEKRTGFQLYDVEDPESVAGHSWNTALLVVLYGEEEEIDVDRALRMAVVHDLAEAETGDFLNRADEEYRSYTDEEKRELEQKFWETFSEELQDKELESLWREYSGRETPEAKFVKDMDLIDMVIQTLKYEKEERYDPGENDDMTYDNLDELFESARDRFYTETGRQLFQEIEERYRRAKQD